MLLRALLFSLIFVLRYFFSLTLNWADQGQLSIALAFSLSLVVNFLSLYLLIVQMRVLGLIYFANKRRLRWFGEEEEEY